MGKWHDLKILPEYFEAVRNQNVNFRKTVEIRKDDRGYEVGDYLRLMEIDPLQYKTIFTGKECHVVITHILRDIIYVPEGFAALSILLIYPNRWD